MLATTPINRLLGVLLLRMGGVALRPSAAAEDARLSPMTGGGGCMCEAQRIDFKAAREGRITWRQYFEKWGDAPMP